MKRAPLPHLALALWLLVPTACTTTSEGAPPSEPRWPSPKTVSTSELRDGALRLSFEPVAPDPTLEVLPVEHARALLADLHTSVSPKRKEGPGSASCWPRRARARARPRSGKCA